MYIYSNKNHVFQTNNHFFYSDSSVVCAPRQIDGFPMWIGCELPALRSCRRFFGYTGVWDVAMKLLFALHLLKMATIYASARYAAE